MTPSRILLFGAAAATSLLLLQNASAQVSRTFQSPAAGTYNWSDTSLWTGSNAPDNSTESARFATATATGNVTLNQDVSGLTIAGLTFENSSSNSSATLTISGNSITIAGAGGINRGATYAGTINFNTDIVLGGNSTQVQTIGAFATANFNGGISGNTLTMAAASNALFTGNLTTAGLVLRGSTTSASQTGQFRAANVNVLGGFTGPIRFQGNSTLSGGQGGSLDTLWTSGTGTVQSSLDFGGVNTTISVNATSNGTTTLQLAQARGGTVNYSTDTIANGTGDKALRLSTITSSGSGNATIRFSGSSWDITRNVEIGGSGVGTADLVVDFANTTGTQTITGSVRQMMSSSGVSTLLRSGVGGTTVLKGNNNTVAAISVTGGTLRAENANALGTGGYVAVGAGNVRGTSVNGANSTLDLAGVSVNEAITLQNGGKIANSSVVEGGVDNGLAGIQVTGNGTGLGVATTISITGGGGSGAAAVSYLSLTNSSIAITNNGSGYTSNPSITSSGFVVNPSFSISRTGNALSSVTINTGAGSVAPAGLFAGAVPTLSVSGGGGTGATLAINDNTFALGAVSLTNAGTGYTSAPTVSVSSGTGVVATAILSGVTLGSGGGKVGGVGTLNIKSVVSGSGSLTKEDANTVILGGANTYTGDTNVDNGVLLINGNSSLATGNVTVTASGALGGNGTVGGATTITGSLQPGSLNAGTLTFANGLNISGVATGGLLFELGTASDLVAITGGAFNIGTLEGADFTFTQGTGFGAPSYTLFTSAGITGTVDPSSFDLGNGYTGALAIAGNDVILNVTAVPEPSTWALLIVTFLGVMVVIRRRRAHLA